MELVSIKDAPKEFKIKLLHELGYDVDSRGVFVIKDGRVALDPYIEKPVRFDNMAIFPGSTIVIDDNPVSIAMYLEAHEEVAQY